MSVVSREEEGDEGDPPKRSRRNNIMIVSMGWKVGEGAERTKGDSCERKRPRYIGSPFL